MCGILGLVLRDPEKHPSDAAFDVLRRLMLLSESRGKEAAGLVVRGRTRFDVRKSPESASAFVRSGAFAELRDIASREYRRHGWVAVMGHTRLVTHGFEGASHNNQPVVAGNTVCVHNGIITNYERLLLEQPSLGIDVELDTAALAGIIDAEKSEGGLGRAMCEAYGRIEGTASVAALFADMPWMALGTNVGSVYFMEQDAGALVFASERYILERLRGYCLPLGAFADCPIQRLSPGRGRLVDLAGGGDLSFALDGSDGAAGPVSEEDATVPLSVESSSSRPMPPRRRRPRLSAQSRNTMLARWRHIYGGGAELRRCSKCLLPHTMTYIDFDGDGVCNYCRTHKRIAVQGEEALRRRLEPYRRPDRDYDCIVPFSGGRDSAYGLHYVKNVLGMRPVAYTYDWGVLTDLGRRNQARICGHLGVEHIIISADIRAKRLNVRRNLAAWLKRPELGMIPILMAGDKQLMHHAVTLKKQLGIRPLLFSYGNGLEDGFFKIGFSGIRMTASKPHQQLAVADKLRLAAYYAGQYARNPSYINRSLLDTMYAFYSIFMLTDDSIHLFNYIPWDEKELLRTIIDEYGWESEPETAATWRIDDGTSPFYNYIYMAVAGFTEFETFRSIQVREGTLGREEALARVREENRPRFKEIEWYADIIGFDPDQAVAGVNAIPVMY